MALDRTERVPLGWRTARVAATRPETARATRVLLDVPGWPQHLPGQHLDVRLTAADGYTAQRAYSIASAPGTRGLELVVELLDDGEVSPWLAREARAGDELEVRGPIGGNFVRDPDDPRPLQLVAGGSGVVPGLGVLAHRRRLDLTVRTRLLLSVRFEADVIGAHELARPQPGLTVTTTLTRAAPPGWTGLTGRVDTDVLRQWTIPAADGPLVLVCGPTAFVEVVADGLLALGHDPAQVRIERFGATGS